MVILSSLEEYRKVNPEALETVNGEKVLRPLWQRE